MRRTLPLVGLLVGIALGLAIPIHLSLQYASYLSVAILAAVDTVFDGIKSSLLRQFDERGFLTGFFFNAVLSAALAFVGSYLGLDLALAAVVAFGVRIFNNLAAIRHQILGKTKIASPN